MSHSPLHDLAINFFSVQNSNVLIFFGLTVKVSKTFDCVDHNKLWKTLKRWDITCLLRNLPAGQEERVGTGHEATVWFQIEKRVHQDCILSPCLFNLHVEYIMQNAKLDEAFVLMYGKTNTIS